MSTRLIVLNGASSSGKSGLARCLQAVLPQPWLTLGVDSLIAAMPTALTISSEGLKVGADGTVIVGPEFRELERVWMAGVAAMVRAGARIIIDEVFLGGAASQQRWLDALGEIPTLWVGVRCDPEVATGREIARGDRVPGMAAAQAEIVHEGIRYDVEVDTSHTESMACARIVAGALG
ncbi:MAG TPA: chloramphenicol phosphotransferase CPT [Pseudonocardiaceae bacterium]|nr:chloramphenicol phosphotransferase CPT [Pseudonocardiaceae bacterium]